MTKRELKALYEAINSCLNLKGGRFSYTLVKAKNLIEGEYKSLMAAVVIPEAYVEYTKKRQEMNEEYCEKDQRGKSVLNAIGGKNFYKISKFKLPEYKAKETELKKVYFEAIGEFEKHQAEFEKLLDEPIKVKLPQMKIEDLPADITGEQLIALSVLVEGMQ